MTTQNAHRDDKMLLANIRYFTSLYQTLSPVNKAQPISYHIVSGNSTD